VRAWVSSAVTGVAASKQARSKQAPSKRAKAKPTGSSAVSRQTMARQTASKLALSGMVVGSGLIATVSPAAASDLELKIEIPRMTVAEYHRPYVAIWVEGADQAVAANLAVWYDVKLKNNEGTKWLKDMRQWWRKTGRDLQVPVDGVTGATRPAGTHTVTFSGAKGPLASLAPGSYTLVVEAAREVGGRELLRVPFDWPSKAAATKTAQGEHELGAIALTVKP
jgi:hypothetical protein